jgi:hypothetical protein
MSIIEGKLGGRPLLLSQTPVWSSSAFRASREPQRQQIRAETLDPLAQLRHLRHLRRVFLDQRDDVQQILPPLGVFDP